MAKRKRSTALFEVITKPQPYARANDRPRAGTKLVASAGQWLKKQLHADPAPRAALPVTVPAAPMQAAAPSAFVAAQPTLTLVQTPPEHIAAAPQLEDADEWHGSHESTPSLAKVSVAVDYEARQISLRMSYTTALIAAAALFIAVGLSVLLVQHFGRHGDLLLAEKTTDKIRSGPPHSDVLSIQRFPSTPVTSINVIEGTSPNGTSPTNAPGPDNRSAPPSVAGDGKRYIGLNYVIVQSYPVAEEKMAKEAAALLNKEGISCTIETGVKGYLPITVVGLQGFDRQSSAPFKAYVQRIQQISAKLTTGNHSYKAFAPVAKKWDKLD